MQKNIPIDGELYKVYTVCGHRFEIRYGYYEEGERGRVDPVPIFPDFKQNPVYTQDGFRIVSLIQLPCKEYCPKNISERNDWCGDCIHYDGDKNEIAVCRCKNTTR